MSITDHWNKVLVLNRFSRGDPLHVIKSEQVLQKVNSFDVHQVFVLRVHESLPLLPIVDTEHGFETLVQTDVVLVQVLVELVGSQHFDDADELVGVVVAVKKRLFSEDHGCEHAT